MSDWAAWIAGLFAVRSRCSRKKHSMFFYISSYIQSPTRVIKTPMYLRFEIAEHSTHINLACPAVTPVPIFSSEPPSNPLLPPPPAALSLTDDVIAEYIRAVTFVSPPTDSRIVFTGAVAPTRVNQPSDSSASVAQQTSGTSAASAQQTQRPAQLLTEDERLEELKKQYLDDIMAVASAEGENAASDPQELLEKLSEIQKQYQQAAPVTAAGAGVGGSDQTSTAELSDAERLASIQAQYEPSDIAGVAPVRQGPLTPTVSSRPVRPAPSVSRPAATRPTSGAGPTDAERLAELQKLYEQEQANTAPVRAGPTAAAVTGGGILGPSPSLSVSQAQLAEQQDELNELEKLFELQTQYSHSPESSSTAQVAPVRVSSAGAVSGQSTPHRPASVRPAVPGSVPQVVDPHVATLQGQGVRFPSAPAPGVEYPAPHSGGGYGPASQQVHVSVGQPGDPETAVIQQQALAAYQQASVTGGQHRPDQLVQLVHVQQQQRPQKAQLVPVVQHLVQPVHAQAAAQLVALGGTETAGVIQPQLHVAETVTAVQPQLHVAVGGLNEAETVAVQQQALAAYQEVAAAEQQGQVQAVLNVPHEVQQVQYVQQVQQVPQVVEGEYVNVVPHVLTSADSAPYEVSVGSLEPAEALKAQQVALSAFQAAEAQSGGHSVAVAQPAVLTQAQLVHAQQVEEVGAVDYTPEQLAALVQLQQHQVTEEGSSNSTISSLLAQKLELLKGLPAKAVFGIPAMLLMASLTAGAFI